MARTSHERFVQNAQAFNAKLDTREKKERRRTTRIIFLPFLALILFMAVTQGQQNSDGGAYDSATKWAEHGPNVYEMTYLITVFGGDELGPTTVHVEDGLLQTYETASPQLEDAPRHTVESLLFAIEQTARGTAGDVTEVTYHEELGYPTEVAFDPDITRVGDEWSIAVTTLTPLTSGVEAAD